MGNGSRDHFYLINVEAIAFIGSRTLLIPRELVASLSENAPIFANWSLIIF